MPALEQHGARRDWPRALGESAQARDPDEVHWTGQAARSDSSRSISFAAVESAWPTTWSMFRYW